MTETLHDMLNGWPHAGPPWFLNYKAVMATNWVRIEREPDNTYLCWDDGRHHLGLDLWAAGTLEWFYTDRATGAMEGTNGDKVCELPARFFSYLQGLQDSYASGGKP